MLKKMSRKMSISSHWLVLLIAIIAVFSTQHSSDALQAFYSDDVLRLNPRHGKWSQSIENLGQILKLRDTVSDHKVFPCKFTIETRDRNTVRQIDFKPDLYLFGGSRRKYMFDLNELARSGFNPQRRTIVLIPGYLTDDVEEWIEESAELWLAIESVNVIKVSWSNGNRYRYERAVSGTPIVARQITILLHHLFALHGLKITDPKVATRIQIVGHSLGAHIGAFVGQDLGGRLGRITGLDPAGVFFDLKPRDQRLDPTDAQLVDVIHTNSGKFSYLECIMSVPAAGGNWFLERVPVVNKLYSKTKETFCESYSREANTSWFGIDQQVGHIDFYANDGRVQPECDGSMHVCDHNRATSIYLHFLAYERDMLLKYDRQILKQNRLLSFKAPDYHSFFTGSSLAQNCQAILGASSQAREGLRKSLRGCSLPMDLTSEVEDLIREYRHEYGVQTLESPTAPLPATKYYFSTRGTALLVGNHFMLKIFMIPPNSHHQDYVWKPECTLNVELLSANGLKTKLTLLKEPEKGYGIGDQFLITALFNAPADYGPIVRRPASGGPAIDQAITSTTAASQVDLEAEARRSLPTRVNFSISAVKRSHSLVGAWVNKAVSCFSVKKAPTECPLYVKSVEIVPLIDADQTYVGHYRDRNSAPVVSAGIELSLELASVTFTD